MLKGDNKMNAEEAKIIKLKNKHLIFRLNRAIGQIEAIKRDLSNDQEEQDCVKTFNQLKASINALKKFGQINDLVLDKTCQIFKTSRTKIVFFLFFMYFILIHYLAYF